MKLQRWLHLGRSVSWWRVGLKLKQILLLLGIGITFLGLGAGYLLKVLYQSDLRFPSWVSVLTLPFLNHGARGAILLVVGVVVTVVGLLGFNQALINALLPRGTRPFVDLLYLYQRRQLLRGPKVVTLGGGAGLSVVLKGLKSYSSNLTAIVTVADDGGSSGVLRKELRILPPGDFRQCITALADVEPLMVTLLQYRFRQGTGLEGHNLGNLLLAAMADIAGNFELGLRDISHVLAVEGRILPSTLQDVTLIAELSDKSTVHGESNMHRDHASAHMELDGRAPIDRVLLQPPDAAGYPESVQAIMDADIVVVGPGSLYTSVLPNLLVKDVARACAASPAFKVFVCNVATEPGETDQYSAEHFLAAVERHVGHQLFDAVITNTRLDAMHPSHWHSDVVRAEARDGDGARMIAVDVVDQHNALRHDSVKLARAIMRAWADHQRDELHPSPDNWKRRRAV